MTEKIGNVQMADGSDYNVEETNMRIHDELIREQHLTYEP